MILDFLAKSVMLWDKKKFSELEIINSRGGQRRFFSDKKSANKDSDNWNLFQDSNLLILMSSRAETLCTILIESGWHFRHFVNRIVPFREGVIA